MVRRNQRILLTGGTGQVGSELLDSLAILGDVIAPGREKFDLAEPETLRDKIRAWKPDLIVNAAAYTAVDTAEEEHALAFCVNSFSPRVISEEADRQSIPVIHFSTDYVFDGTKNSPYQELDAPNPLNVYGESKLQGEVEIRNTDAKHIILRTSWIYGRRGHNFLNTMLELFAHDSQVRVVDDQIGAPTSAAFVATITTLVAFGALRKYIDVGRDVYHITSNGSTSWYGFAKEIQRLSKRVVRVCSVSSGEYPVKAKRPSNSLLDNRKIERAFRINRPNWTALLFSEMEKINEAK